MASPHLCRPRRRSAACQPRDPRRTGADLDRGTAGRIRSWAAEWTVAQASSYILCGAHLLRRLIATAAGGAGSRPRTTNRSGPGGTLASPADQAAGFVKHDAAYLYTAQALSAEQRDCLRSTWRPARSRCRWVVALGMRLTEVANHAWDVRVGVDPSATVDPDSAELLVELFGRAARLPSGLCRQGRSGRAGGPPGDPGRRHPRSPTRSP